MEVSIHLAWTIITPVLPKFAKSLSVGAFEIGLIFAVFGVGRMVINVPAGQFAERLGRRAVLLGGAGVVVISVFLSGMANDIWLLLFWRFVTGLGGGAFTTAGMTILADITTLRTRGRVMAIYQGSMLVGAAMGPVPGGFLGEYFGFRAPFLFSAVLALVFTLWGLLRLKETKGWRLSESGVGHGVAHSRPAGWGGLRLLTDVSFLLICLVNFTTFFTRIGGRNTVVPLVAYEQIYLSESQLGTVLGMAAILDFAMLYFSGWMVDRFGRKSVIVPSNLLIGLSMFLFAISGSLPLFLIATATMGIGMGVGGPAPAAYVADLAQDGLRGITMGLYRTFGDVAYFIGPLLVGWLADFQGRGWALNFNAALVVVVAILFWAFARETLTPELRRRLAQVPREVKG